MSGNSTLLKAAKLWSKTSKNGNDYLAGRLGGAKVLVMENRDHQSENDPSPYPELNDEVPEFA